MFSSECPRGFDNCSVLDNICSDDVTKSDKKPVTFVCCGSSDPKTRHLKQDQYRICFKSLGHDSITDNDEFDILDLISVLSRSLSIRARNYENSKKKPQRKHASKNRSRYG